LDIDLNDFLEPMDEEVELISQKTENKNKAEQVKVTSPQKGNPCKDELELLSEDFKDFLEPMAEEVALISQQKQDEFKDFLEPMAEELELMSKQRKEMLSPKIETEKKTLLVIPTENSSRTVSPDIFNSDSLSPWKPQGKSLAAKLAAKTKACTPPNSVSLNSPENRKRTNPLAQDKSPSIFDLYLNRMRGRGRLAKAAETLHRMTSTNTSIPLAKDDEDSPIARRPSKRKIVISSDDEEEQKHQVAETQADYESDDYEQIPNTQMVFSLLETYLTSLHVNYIFQLETPTPPPKPRHKRSKFNSFILDEAEKSGSDHEEEGETTIGAYLKDSVIVSSDDEDHNDTNAHAIYLRAMKCVLVDLYLLSKVITY